MSAETAAGGLRRRAGWALGGRLALAGKPLVEAVEYFPGDRLPLGGGEAGDEVAFLEPAEVGAQLPGLLEDAGQEDLDAVGVGQWKIVGQS